jgi:signal transduction histidine kinase
MTLSMRNNCLKGRIMTPRGEKSSQPLCAEPAGGPARSELIKLIRHRLHEPLGPTLLVLQLLLREESLSPQGIALIRMLQRSIKEEVRAIQELLTIIETFIQDPVDADSRTEQKLEESSQSGLS